MDSEIDVHSTFALVPPELTFIKSHWPKNKIEKKKITETKVSTF